MFFLKVPSAVLTLSTKFLPPLESEDDDDDDDDDDGEGRTLRSSRSVERRPRGDGNGVNK